MKRVYQLIVSLIYLVMFLIPGFTYFVVDKRATLDLLSVASLGDQLLIVFRLFGLYALTLAWSQIMLGVFRIPLTRLFGTNILKFHITFGLFTLLFATLHPLLFYLGILLTQPTTPLLDALGTYLGHGPATIYGYLGPVAWTVMVVTVLTALLRKRPFMQRYWRFIHYGNYFVFLFAFVHSLMIGTEVQLQPLHFLYYFMGLTFLIPVIYRWGYQRFWLRRHSASL